MADREGKELGLFDLAASQESGQGAAEGQGAKELVGLGAKGRRNRERVAYIGVDYGLVARVHRGVL